MELPTGGDPERKEPSGVSSLVPSTLGTSPGNNGPAHRVTVMATRPSEKIIAVGNPPTPNRPDDLSQRDPTHMESKLVDVALATDG